MSALHTQRLLQEHPWIINIVGGKTFDDAKVKRLDKDCLANYGRICRGYSYDRWYLVNKDGLLLNEVSFRKPVTFFQRLFPFLSSSRRETVIAGIVRTMREFPEQEITYVLNACAGLRLHLYKIPKGHTMATFLDTVQEKIAAELNEES